MKSGRAVVTTPEVVVEVDQEEALLMGVPEGDTKAAVEVCAGVTGLAVAEG